MKTLAEGEEKENDDEEDPITPSILVFYHPNIKSIKDDIRMFTDHQNMRE